MQEGCSSEKPKVNSTTFLPLISWLLLMKNLSYFTPLNIWSKQWTDQKTPQKLSSYNFFYLFFYWDNAFLPGYMGCVWQNFLQLLYIHCFILFTHSYFTLSSLLYPSILFFPASFLLFSSIQSLVPPYSLSPQYFHLFLSTLREG